MVDDFRERIRQRYDPEGGLTGVFAVGGTRTTYILDQNRHAAEPGKIDDFEGHTDYLEQRYRNLIKMYFDLGGRNMILTIFSFRSFEERGQEYATLIIPQILKTIESSWQQFYREHQIDPYFVGVDTLNLDICPEPVRAMSQAVVQFQREWPYQPDHYKLIWEIASIPNYTLWQLIRAMSEADAAALEADVKAQPTMEDVARTMHRHFSRTIYGTEIPMPHFYLGTNRNGDLKWRSPMPLALAGGEFLRMFYTPYPSLFITRETMQTFLEDLAFAKRLQALKKDYTGQYTPELAEKEYQRVVDLAARPDTLVGLSRKLSK